MQGTLVPHVRHFILILAVHWTESTKTIAWSVRHPSSSVTYTHPNMNATCHFTHMREERVILARCDRHGLPGGRKKSQIGDTNINMTERLSIYMEKLHSDSILCSQHSLVQRLGLHHNPLLERCHPLFTFPLLPFQLSIDSL